MNIKVILENGVTQIILKAENDFEKDVIDKVHTNKNRFNVQTLFDARYNYGEYTDQQILIVIKKV